MRDSIQNHQDGAQPDWRAVVQEAQERINILGAALDDMRSVVRDLSFLAQHLPAEPAPVAAPVAQVVEAPVAIKEVKPPAPPLDHDSLSSSSWPSRLETHTVEPEGPPPTPRRHEELLEKPETPFIDFGSMMRDDGWGAPSPRIEEEKEPDPIAEERDEVRRAVEAARAELDASRAEIESAVDDAETSVEEAIAEVDPQAEAREEVRRTVERARSEWDLNEPPEPITWAIAQTEAAEEGEPSTDARDEVRRAVEQARAELEQDRAAAPGALWPAEKSGWANNSGWPGSTRNTIEAANESEQPETDDDRDAVRRAVEEARAEMEAEMLADDADATDEAGPSYQERDEIRRTVALARAELELSAMNDEDAPRPDLMAAMAAPRRASWESPTIDEAALMPPVMVIEDAERHVELSRVYEVLSRLECTQQASLLNYAPHNVSIGLTSRESMPQPEAIKAAVKAVFGRGCSVVLEGSRLSVSIGDDQGRAA